MPGKYSPSRVVDDTVADAMAADIIPLLDNLPASPMAASLFNGVKVGRGVIDLGGPAI